MVLHDLRYTTANRPVGGGQTRDDGVDRINGSLDRRPQDRDAHRCPTDQHDREKAQRAAIGGHDTRSLALSVGKWCAVFSHRGARPASMPKKRMIARRTASIAIRLPTN